MEEAAALGAALGAIVMPFDDESAVRMKQPKAPGREARRRGSASAQTKLTEFRRASACVEDADAVAEEEPARVEDADAGLDEWTKAPGIGSRSSEGAARPGENETGVEAQGAGVQGGPAAP